MNKWLMLLFVTSIYADISFDIDESMYSDVEKKADKNFKEVTKRQQKIIKKMFSGITSSNYTYPNNHSSQAGKISKTNKNSSKSEKVNISKGIKHITYNGKIGGVKTYLITCKSGKSTVIKKLKGSWYTGFLGDMGHKFDNWSKAEVGEYICTH